MKMGLNTRQTMGTGVGRDFCRQHAHFTQVAVYPELKPLAFFDF
jgi:hypothetical protein